MVRHALPSFVWYPSKSIPVLPGSAFSFTQTKQSQKLYNLPLSLHIIQQHSLHPLPHASSLPPNPTTLLAMQFFKSTLFVAIAVAASFVAAAPAQSECLPLIGKCTFDSDCCSNECIASSASHGFAPLGWLDHRPYLLGNYGHRIAFSKHPPALTFLSPPDHSSSPAAIGVPPPPIQSNGASQDTTPPSTPTPSQVDPKKFLVDMAVDIMDGAGLPPHSSAPKDWMQATFKEPPHWSDSVAPAASRRNGRWGGMSENETFCAIRRPVPDISRF
ncbi:hypothetical protein FIBSPDRAFT_1015425 [Athelia psychrophila]|uniref:Uncharacterized protein n=1 Tax=Athelia psychrophila TaxID=1759441 RepID=A0A166LWN8_9AGAM|nr:hypothetical protein FIBSPDRAFT_1015425 [Fibularhizoctonia sp. CBS 109695]